jgi:hypothetical protein
MSTFDLLGLPTEIRGIIIALALVAFMAPWAAGVDFGFLKVPVFSQVTRTRLRIWGPVALVATIALNLPLWSISKTGKPQVEDSLTTILDLSQDQGRWESFNSWLQASEVPYRELHQFPESLKNPGGRVLILALPYHKHLSASKIAAISAWVERGGGLFVLGYYAADVHHGANPSELTKQWGVSFQADVLLPSDAASCDRGHVFSTMASYGVRIVVPPDAVQKLPQLFTEARELTLVSSSSLKINSNRLRPTLVLHSGARTQICRAIPTRCSASGTDCAVDWEPSGGEPVPVFVAFEYGRGRVAVAGTWKIVNPDLGDNGRFVKNVLEWLVSAP